MVSDANLRKLSRIVPLVLFLLISAILIFIVDINSIVENTNLNLGELLLIVSVSFIISVPVSILIRVITIGYIRISQSSGENSDIIFENDPQQQEIVSSMQFDQTAIKYMNQRVEDVLEKQIHDLHDIDDAAMRTLRINIILLGALASFAQIGNSLIDITQTHTTIGLFLIVVSSALAILTYHSSNPEFGPGQAYIEDFAKSRYNREFWRLETTLAYADWVNENAEINRDNGTLLLLCHLSLVLGLAMILFGIYSTLQMEANQGQFIFVPVSIPL